MERCAGDLPAIDIIHRKRETMKEYEVQFRVVAIVGIKIKATDLQDALEAAKSYTLDRFIKPNKMEIHEGVVKVVGVDDEWGDVQ